MSHLLVGRPEVIGIEADVGQERRVRAAVAAVHEQFGAVCIPCNNAGIPGPVKPLAGTVFDGGLLVARGSDKPRDVSSSAPAGGR